MGSTFFNKYLLPLNVLLIPEKICRENILKLKYLWTVSWSVNSYKP